MQHLAVIGAGITGVTTSYALARRGYAVTLFDRHHYPAMETSFANGGQLSASNAEVWNHWSTIAKGLRWMTRRDAPLLVHPGPTWHKLSWFAQFVGSADVPHYDYEAASQKGLDVKAFQRLWNRNHPSDTIDEDGADIGGLRGIDQRRSRIVRGQAVHAAEINDGEIGALADAQGAGEVVDAKRSGAADGRHA